MEVELRLQILVDVATCDKLNLKEWVCRERMVTRCIAVNSKIHYSFRRLLVIISIVASLQLIVST